jgi:hypothetical protein
MGVDVAVGLGVDVKSAVGVCGTGVAVSGTDVDVAVDGTDVMVDGIDVTVDGIDVGAAVGAAHALTPTLKIRPII